MAESLEQLKAKRFYMLGMLHEKLPEEFEKVKAATAAIKQTMDQFEPEVASLALSLTMVEHALALKEEENASNT